MSAQLSEDQIKAGMVSLDAGHPFMRALLALLDDEVEQESDALTNPNLTDGARHFNSGRLGHAKDFRRAMVGIMDQARREAAERLAKAEREKQG